MSPSRLFSFSWISGLITIRTRKVKCDEGKPSCHRCVSTGRVCEGYGIWGGGNPPYHRSSNVLHRDPAPLGIVNARQQSCFEWFMLRTAPKLPSAFSSAFWSSLVFQATSSEPAALHAALALGSAHRQNIHLEFQGPASRNSALQDEERFTLLHYGKAIRHLQRHFTSGTLASTRVTLITCLLFICMEILRGQYQSAIAQLHSGLKLLKESKSRLAVENPASSIKDARDFDDYWITETFCRLHVSSALFGQIPSDLYPADITTSNSPRLFSSVNQARHWLDRLLAGTIGLAEKARGLSFPEGLLIPSVLKDAQEKLLLELSCWKTVHTASNALLHCDSTEFSLESFAYGLLEQYHSMAEIMTSTCLKPNNEIQFDSYRTHFLNILERAIPKFQFVFSKKAEKVAPKHFKGISRSVCDVSNRNSLSYQFMPHVRRPTLFYGQLSQS